jgi:serine/threonine-protein kinase
MVASHTDRVVGRYRVQRLLAEGGMGRVLLARTDGPAGFTKLVVLKTLHPHLAADAGALETFLVEARVTAALFHPNVAQVFELVEDAGEYFLAMEYVRGRSLRELVSASPRLPLPIALAIASQVLRALQHAHEVKDEQGRPLNVLHRDVSPENVLVTWDGAVKLVDFGLAGTKRRAGKEGYLAPELLEGAPPSVASDLYAAGVLLAECLAGPLPFTTLEAPWGPVVSRALDPDPAKRFPSAGAFADALDGLARDAGHHVTQATLAQTLRDTVGAPDDEVVTVAPARRTAVLTQGPAAAPAPVASTGKRRMAGLAVVAVLALGVVGLIAMGGQGEVPAPAEPAPTAGRVPSPPTPASVSAPAAAPVEPVAALEPVKAASPRDVVTSAPAPAPRPRAPAVAPKPEAPPAAADATLDVRVIPWAEVLVDGRAVGTTPLAPVRLAAGRHVIELKNAELGVSTSRTVVLEGGAAERLRVDLLDELDSR